MNTDGANEIRARFAARAAETRQSALDAEARGDLRGAMLLHGAADSLARMAGKSYETMEVRDA